MQRRLIPFLLVVIATAATAVDGFHIFFSDAEDAMLNALTATIWSGGKVVYVTSGDSVASISHSADSLIFYNADDSIIYSRAYSTIDSLVFMRHYVVNDSVVTDTIVTPVDTIVTPVDTIVTPVDTVITPVDTIVTPVDTVVTPVDTIPRDGKLRVLAIGNSFSQDALEYHLGPLLDSIGVEAVIGNAYRAGCTLEWHAIYVRNNSYAYSYRRIEDGVKVTTDSMRLIDILQAEPWDYVSLQQGSTECGQWATYEASLPGLAEWVRTNATNPDVKLLLHQTWAYAWTAPQDAFDYFGCNQHVMYDSIVANYNAAREFVDAWAVVPCGTAVQNGRTSYLGDSFNIEGQHLNQFQGHYTTACTWLEFLTGIDVTTLDNVADGMTADECTVCRAAAHAAVALPDSVTTLTDYLTEPGVPDMDYGWYIDFGSYNSHRPWNNVTVYATTHSMGLVDSRGEYCGVRLTYGNQFSGNDSNGPTVAECDSLWMPTNVSRDSFRGNTGYSYDGNLSGPVTMTIEGLKTDSLYKFTFFSSQTTAYDLRQTQFTISGADSLNCDTLLVNSSRNTTVAVTSRPVVPDADGRITIEVTSGPDNDNPYGFFYLNAMSITPQPRPDDDEDEKIEDPENPDDPEPDDPDNPEPDDPDNPEPDDPDNPEPDEPENPDEPEPDNPENPDDPEPDDPDNPEPDDPEPEEE